MLQQRPALTKHFGRELHVGGQDRDSGEAAEAGGSGTSLGVGAGVGRAFCSGRTGSRPSELGVQRLSHHPETSEHLPWGKPGHAMPHWDSASALGAEGFVRSWPVRGIPVHKSP